MMDAIAYLGRDMQGRLAALRRVIDRRSGRWNEAGGAMLVVLMPVMVHEVLLGIVKKAWMRSVWW